MKELFKFLTAAIYPALITAFIYIFVETFKRYLNYEVISAFSSTIAIIFFVVFLVGAIGYIVTLCRHKNNKN